MGLQEVGWDDMDSVHLDKDRIRGAALVNTIVNFLVS